MRQLSFADVISMHLLSVLLIHELTEFSRVGIVQAFLLLAFTLGIGTVVAFIVLKQNPCTA